VSLQHSPSKRGLTDSQAIQLVCETQIKPTNTTINTAAGNGSSGYNRKTADSENQRWQWTVVAKSLKLMNLDVWQSDLSWLATTNQDENTRRDRLHHSPSLVQVMHRSIKLSFIK